MQKNGSQTLWAHSSEKEMEMERIKGAIEQILVARDEEGAEFACPAGVLRNPNRVSEEEKRDCEPLTPPERVQKTLLTCMEPETIITAETIKNFRPLRRHSFRLFCGNDVGMTNDVGMPSILCVKSTGGVRLPDETSFPAGDGV